MKTSVARPKTLEQHAVPEREAVKHGPREMQRVLASLDQAAGMFQNAARDTKRAAQIVKADDPDRAGELLDMMETAAVSANEGVELLKAADHIVGDEGGFHARGEHPERQQHWTHPSQYAGSLVDLLEDAVKRAEAARAGVSHDDFDDSDYREVSPDIKALRSILARAGSLLETLDDAADTA